MKKISKEIYQRILEGYPLQEIQAMYSIPTKEFSFYLKDLRENGFRFQRTIFSNGRIVLKPNLSLNFNTSHHQKIGLRSEPKFKTLFYSDTHIGNIHERIDYIKLAYQYAQEHDIHIVISAGDLIDNVYPDASPTSIKIPTVDGQIQKLTNVIPEDPNIITLCLYGNHEAHSIITEGRDVARLIEDKRYDMINLGYGGCAIELKGESIGVSHYVKNIPIRDHLKDVVINFRGNSHKSKVSYKDDKEVYIPTLSDNVSSAYEYKPLPGFLVADIIFTGNLIERVNTTQLSIVNDELRMSAEDAIVLRKVPHERRKNSKNPKDIDKK